MVRLLAWDLAGLDRVGRDVNSLLREYRGRAGDVNGDGYSDIIVDSYTFDGGLGWAQGRVYVWCGSSSGLPSAPCWTTTGEQGGSYLSTGAAGDVNGDGYGDVIVAATEYSADQTGEGRAYLYFGSASGLMTTPGWMVESNQAGAHLGYGQPAAGDVNGDGYTDVILGAPLFDAGGHDEGAALLYYGGPAGPSTTADSRVEGNQADANFGISVRTAGDVNGDGYADIIVGAHRYDGGQTDKGAAFIYYGSATGLKTAPARVIEANQAGAYLGEGAGTAGDVNGDGYSDLIITALGYDSSYTDEGAAFVYYGNAGGLSLRPQQRRSDNSAPVALLGQSDQPDRFRLALLGRTPFGRGKVKLEWEVKPPRRPLRWHRLGAQRRLG